MNTRKKFREGAWSLWYVRMALLATLLLWFLAAFFPEAFWEKGLEDLAIMSCYAVHRQIATATLMEKFERIAELRKLDERLTFLEIWVSIPVVLCYVGYTVDLAWKSLVKLSPETSQLLRRRLALMKTATGKILGVDLNT